MKIAVTSFCASDEPKFELAQNLGDRIQSQNVPFGTSEDCVIKFYNISQRILDYTR